MPQAQPPAGGIQLRDNPSQFVQQQASLQGSGADTMQINTVGQRKSQQEEEQARLFEEARQLDLREQHQRSYFDDANQDNYVQQTIDSINATKRAIVQESQEQQQDYTSQDLMTALDEMNLRTSKRQKKMREDEAKKREDESKKQMELNR